MASIIKKRFSCDILDLPEYLKNQAAQGLFLKKITRNRLVFQLEQPKDLDFNIIPVNNSVEFDQIKALDGWEPIATLGEFVIIFAPAGTPFTVASDKNVTLVKLRFMRTMYIIRFALASAGAAFSVLGILQYCTYHLPLTLLSVFLFVALVFFGTLELLPLLRLMRSIKKLQGKENI